MKQRLLFSVIAVGWIAFWFWAFSYALSDGFFEYNRYSRIPTFLSALASVIVIPASAMCLWRAMGAGTRSPAAALGIHLLVVVAALALPLAITHVLARAPQPWHLEADDAMGIGIYLAALALVAVLSIGALAIAMMVRRARKTSPPQRNA